ncbi:hypothetical protein [Flavobacterium sp.]|uniref:hypothetical protein n=1 Tax=Flavobacterium sp. TaxID=239 RepID=UPI002606CF96|nr:hypothetical protein [Flavobacterium sp.]
MNRKHLNIIIVLIGQLTFSQKTTIYDKSYSEILDDEILSIAVDKDYNKWIGTSKNGLLLYKNKEFIPFKKEFISEIKGDYITPIFIDSKKRIWISYSNPKDGITMLDGSTWHNFSENELKNISVISIAEDGNGVLYFGGKNGVITYDGVNWSKLKLPSDEFIVRCINISTNGAMAIGHNEGLLLFQNNIWKNYDEKNSELKLSTVRAVKFIENKLFIGYGGGFGDGGFSILSENSWTHFNKKNSGISDHMVRDIEIDQKGIIWMATNYGLIKYHDNTITPIFFNNGKYTNVIMDIFIENENVWLATTTGLIKYVP